MTEYNVVDNRRLAGLRVADAEKAETASRQPLESFGIDLEPYQPTTEDVRFDLSPFAMQWGEYLLRHSRGKDDTTWLKEFKSLLGAMTPATVVTFRGVDVATFRRDARLNMKRLEKEQPDIVAKYTCKKVVLEFDEDAFKADMPALFHAYRGRSYRLIRNPVTSSLFQAN